MVHDLRNDVILGKIFGLAFVEHFL